MAIIFLVSKCDYDESKKLDYGVAAEQIKKAKHGFHQHDSCIRVIVEDIRAHIEDLDMEESGYIMDRLYDLEMELDEDSYDQWGSLEDLDRYLFDICYQ